MSFVKNMLLAASIATVGTTLTTALLGREENGDPAAPLNATSHIVWGDEAASESGFSPKYTLTGIVVNAGAMLGWAAIQELVFGRWVRKGPPSRAVVAGAATSAAAYATDYHVVPERLTPGFERRLSPGEMAVVYGVLAASLAFGVRRSR